MRRTGAASALAVTAVVLLPGPSGDHVARAQLCIPPPCAEPTPAPEPTATPTSTATPLPAGPVGPTSDASTTRVDAARSGWVPGATLVPPLVPVWTRRLGSPVGQPVVGDGRVFLTHGATYNGASITLTALDARTGRTLWSSPLKPGGRNLGYGGGVLVSSGDSNGSEAFDANTGASMWTGPSFGGDPVVTGGAVYGKTTAVEAATGKEIWRHYDPGFSGSVAVDESGVYLAAVCEYAYSIDRRTGKNRWETGGTCASGGGGGIATLAPGRVIAAEYSSHKLLDAATGRTVGAFSSTVQPVVIGDRIYTSTYSTRTQRLTLYARRAADAQAAWSRVVDRGSASREIDGDSSMLGAGRWLFRQNGATVVAHAAADGRAVWGSRFEVYSPSRDGGGFGRSMAAAPGLLVTVGGRQVTGWTSLFQPAPGAVDALPERSVVYGEKARLVGRAGASLAGARVRFVAGSRTRAVAKAGPDGYVAATARVERNTRLRAVAGRARSRAFTVYVYPRERFGFRRPGTNRVLVRVTLRGPRSVRLAGHRVVLYLARPGQRGGHYDRLGSGRLTGGGGSARSSIAIRALRQVDYDDYLVTCVPGQARLGLGSSRDPLVRRCGRSRVAF